MTFKLIREPKMPTMAEVATRTADQWRSCERLALDRLRRATNARQRQRAMDRMEFCSVAAWLRENGGM